jgi:hypothetical protein
MTWTKHGRILTGAPASPELVSHAAVPFVDLEGRGASRLYFSARDAHNRSHTLSTAMAFDAGAARLSDEPPRVVLAPGRLGAFDDSGAMGSWLVTDGGTKYLYYFGWNLGVTVPFRNAIGLAVSEDGGRTFARYSDGPILDRNVHDPYFTSNPAVLKEGSLWRMWYVSGTGWDLVAGRPRHQYVIKYAESLDGIRWDRTGVVAIGLEADGEYAIARPSVIRDGDVYRMWYSYRGDAYRIGYAESADGIVWDRNDRLAGLEPGPDSWDEAMIEYPFVFDAPGGRYMLYNGNDFGRTGIGLATVDQR